jgi:phosphoenolpyruvate synthase/pyruvate phosphate dikinase
VPNYFILEIGDNFEKKIERLNQTKKYVVRSNMLVEDSKNSSFAGQFKTFINLNFDEIIFSIEDVILDAKNK